ncbi:MAG: hypothetical protein DRJ40_03210 [Thermoprotei archaeon]|nr:MAG: hypothetical protein DRJ40_03210 [Thermoprotei archaeon]
MRIEGLLSFTRGKWVRGLHIIYLDVLISMMAVRKDFTVIVTFSKGPAYTVDEDNLKSSCMKFVSAMDGLINIVESTLRLGHYTYFGEFTYVPSKYMKFKTYYMELEIYPEVVKLTMGDIEKRYRGTRSGYRPGDMLKVLNAVFNKVNELRRGSS